jgi:cellulose synthase/poly-beta-1,6-N-acetylglucosamine synthase-like glycosyltransferase
MFYFHKKHTVHKRLLSVAFLFAIIPMIIWIDVLYDFFRDTILLPLYYSICDECYIVLMLGFPIISLFFSLWGYLKAPRGDKQISLFFVWLSVALIILMGYILSPLGEIPVQ